MFEKIGNKLIRPLIYWTTSPPQKKNPNPNQLLKGNCWKETSGGNASPIPISSSGCHSLHFPGCDTVLHRTSRWDHTSEYGLQATFTKHGNHYVWFCFLPQYIRNVSHPLVISLMLAWNPRYAQKLLLHKLQTYVTMEAGISNQEPALRCQHSCREKPKTSHS